MYVPIDVNFPDDDKIIAVGPEAAGIYVMALCVAKRLMKDGALRRAHLIRLGATSAVIEALLASDLVRADGPDKITIPAWLDHNASVEEINAKRSTDAQRKRVSRRNRPRDVQPDAPDASADVRALEVEVEVEVEATTPLISQGTSGSDPLDSANHATEADGVRLTGDDLTQAQRRTAALVGRALAALRAGSNPEGYAATTTSRILAAEDGGLDLERITRLLHAGRSPEDIARDWAEDPFGAPRAPATPARHATPAPVDAIRAQADDAAPDPRSHLAAIRGGAA